MGNTDWESIEREYRAGALSVREIAKRNGVTHGGIRKRAGKEGWTRDLSAKVRAAVSTALVSATVSTETSGDKARTERKIVEDAASAVVALVREHRKDLSRGRGLVDKLLAQLDTAADARDVIEALIDEETAFAPDDSQATKQRKEAQRRAMLAAVSLPAHAGVLKDLATVLKSLIPLERQAFNMDAAPVTEGSDAGFAAILEAGWQRVRAQRRAAIEGTATIVDG